VQTKLDAVLDRLPVNVAQSVAKRARALQDQTGIESSQAVRYALEQAGVVRNPLDHFCQHNIPVIGTYESGAYIAKEDDFRAAFTTSIAVIAALQVGKGDPAGRAKGVQIARYRFEPGPAGLLCLDLDRGHVNEADGISSLYDKLRREAVALPYYLADLEAGTFPVYTLTPSGGMHLYFRYLGGRRFIHKTIAPGVEVFHFGNLLTVPGSLKAGKPYIMIGELDDAPALPGFLEQIIIQAHAPAARQEPRPYFGAKSRERERPSLERLAEWALTDGSYEGRNRLAFEVARRASRPDYKYTAQEVADFLATFQPVAGLPPAEIITAVKSAFKGT